MSISGYDFRKRGVLVWLRRFWRSRPRLRSMTPGELALAGWMLYWAAGLTVALAVDQPEVTRWFSSWLDEQPQVAEESGTTR